MANPFQFYPEDKPTSETPETKATSTPVTPETKLSPTRRGPQVNLATVVPEAFRDEINDLARQHRLRLREFLFALVAFYKTYLPAHQEFDPKSFKQPVSRKQG